METASEKKLAEILSRSTTQGVQPKKFKEAKEVTLHITL